MDYIKINEYPLERLVFGDNDYYDVDYYDGVGYQSAKILGSVIKAGILSAVETIYNSDGTLTSDRTIQGDLFSLFINNLRKFSVNVNPAPFGMPAIEFTVVPNGDLLRIKDSTANINRLRIFSNGQVEINEEYKLPLLDGTAGQVLATDGAGNVSFITLPPAPSDTNIYNSNGILTADRTLDGANFELLLQNLGKFSVHSHLNNAENIEFRVRTNTGFYSFVIRDHNTNASLLAVKDGKTEINGVYTLPTITGTSGQVLTSNGAGLTSWQNIPQVWRAPDIQLLDALASGGLTSAVNTGAGYNRYFNGTGTAGRLSFNIGLRNNGVDYDGASIQIRFSYQLFNTNGGGNVSFSVIYKFVTANGTTNAETGATTVTTLVNVTGRAVNTLYEDLLATISGASGSDVLMLSIVRNTGTGNTDLIDGIGIELLRI